MEIKATSKNDASTVKRLHRAAFRVGNGHIKFAAGALFIVILSVINLIVGKGFKHFAWGYLILLAVWLGVYGYTYFLAPTRAYRKDKRVRKAENVFTFSDNAVTVISKNEMAYEKQVVPYEAVYRLCEDLKHFYIFLSPDIGYVADKSTVSGGTEAELRGFLFGQFGTKRYILFNKEDLSD